MHILTMWEYYHCSSKSFQTEEEAQAFYKKVSKKDKERCQVIYIHNTKSDTKKILKNTKS